MGAGEASQTTCFVTKTLKVTSNRETKGDSANANTPITTLLLDSPRDHQSFSSWNNPILSSSYTSHFSVSFLKIISFPAAGYI